MSRVFNILKPCVVNHRFYEKGEVLTIPTRDEDKLFVRQLISHNFVQEWCPDLYKERKKLGEAPVACKLEDLGNGYYLKKELYHGHPTLN